jgi:hypothetical protein
MKTRMLATLALLLLAVLPARHAAAHGGVRHDLLLVNGRWWDGSRFVLRDRVYTVEGVIRPSHAGAVEDTIDLTGRFVAPPFADAHTHLLSDTADFARSLRVLLGAGVLFAQNVNSPGSQVAAVRARLAAPGTLEMRFTNGGLTSPGGHPAQIYDPAPERRRWAGDAYVEVASEADLRAQWPGILRGKPDRIKAYLERSELGGKGETAAYGRHGLDATLLPAIVRLAREAKLPVSVHVTSAEDFRVAVAAGVDEIAHLPLERIRPADAAEAARRKVTVVTTVLSHRPAEGVGDPAALHRENLRLLRDAGVAVALGTDHPLRTVADEAIELCRIGAYDPASVIQTLGEATVRHVFPGRRVGKLAAGDEASFVVLEADPIAAITSLKRVVWSMKQGHRVELPAAPSGKRAVAETLAVHLMRGDLDGALALHDRLRRERPDDFDFGEQQLNGLGYRMMQHGAAAGAVTLFRRNAELFPASGNVYDSLAEGLLAAGDTLGAVRAYEKVLEVLDAHPDYGPRVREGLRKRATEFLASRARKP